MALRAARIVKQLTPHTRVVVVVVVVVQVSVVTVVKLSTT